MVAKSKRIMDKLVWEADTPIEADADGYSDGLILPPLSAIRGFILFKFGEKRLDASRRMFTA